MEQEKERIRRKALAVAAARVEILRRSIKRVPATKFPIHRRSPELISNPQIASIAHLSISQQFPDPSKQNVLRAGVEKLEFAINNSYAPQTSHNHDLSVKRYLHFTSSCGFSEEASLPASPELVCLWAASGIGRTGPGNAQANISALAAWHRAHDFPFIVPERFRTIKRALSMHWPKERSEKRFRPPVTPMMIRLLSREWSNGSSQQLCALAIALAAWSGQMRLGELLPSSHRSVDRLRLPKRSAWSQSTSLSRGSSIKLPWTKTTKFKGALVFLQPQKGPFDTTSAILAHLTSSPATSSSLLCEFRDSGLLSVLDKPTFMTMCNEIWSRHGFLRCTGHSFRIGGTTSLLRAGVNPDIVKKMGGWHSDAFLIYWHNLQDLFADHAADIAFVDVTV